MVFLVVFAVILLAAAVFFAVIGIKYRVFFRESQRDFPAAGLSDGMVPQGFAPSERGFISMRIHGGRRIPEPDIHHGRRGDQSGMYSFILSREKRTSDTPGRHLRRRKQGVACKQDGVGEELLCVGDTWEALIDESTDRTP